MNRKCLAEEYKVCSRTIDNRIHDIRMLIGIRYPESAVIRTGRFIRVRDDVFKDMMMYHDAIAKGYAPKFVPHEKHVWEVNEA